jgi:hypothetical protein
MAEKKHKREPSGFIELDTEEVGFVLEPTQVEIGSGYTVCVSYDEDEKPVIDVKTYGEVNTAKLRKDIKKMFPNAQIRQLNQTQTVTIVKKRKRKPNTKKK